MKTNILYLTLFLWMALTSFWGCADHIEGITPDEPEVVIPENPGINVKNKKLLFDASGVAQGINIRAIGSKWKAYPGETCPWLTQISPAEGEAGNNVIGVTLAANESMEERFTYMVIKHEESGDTVHVDIKQYTHESKYSRQTDSLALVVIQEALTKSSEWRTPWDLKKPITTWAGLEFEEVRGEQRVVGINTREFQIYGELPNELGNLRELKKLAITGGSITGRIPVTITSLRKLEEINIPFKDGYAEWYVPENVGDMKALRILNVSYLKIAPEFFKNLYKIPTLETITMRAFEGDLPEGISALINLKELTLSYTKVASLPLDMGNIPNLEKLDLSNCNKLLNLGNNLGQLTKLKTLNLSYCSKVTAIPENIGQLQNLATLNISGCSALISIPESFTNLSYLTTLNFNGCESLQQLPSQIGSMSQVTAVDLSSCKSLIALPESFGNLTKLTKLQLRSCSALASLPESIGNLSAVTEIEMTSCDGINSFPESLGRMSNLKKFTFSSTINPVALPSTFSNLVNLEEFNCGQYSPNNGGVSGDLSIFRNMSKLKTIRANYNKLSGDPSVLGNLPLLTTIELGSNRLSGTLDLSKLLTNKLTSVDLSNNGLSGTLDGMTMGTALTKLALNNNKITGNLPENIDLCSKLTTLYLQDNLITGNIPVTIIKLNLTYGGLVLKNNNMSGVIAPEILNSTGWKSKWYPQDNILPQNPGYELKEK